MEDVKIYTHENVKELKSIPILEDGQIYIYALLSSNGNIKIGKTINIIQRIISLSGSNGGGSKLTHIYCSPATWMQSMEKTCHNHFDRYRIKGTEWFDGSKLNYEEVVKYVDDLFHSEGFARCNETRKQFIENKGISYDNKRD